MRVTLNILFFVSIFAFPWWFAAMVGVLLLFQYTAYEVIVGAVLFDLLHGQPLMPYIPVPVIATLIGVFSFLVIEYAKPYLSFYDRSSL